MSYWDEAMREAYEEAYPYPYASGGVVNRPSAGTTELMLPLENRLTMRTVNSTFNSKGLGGRLSDVEKQLKWGLDYIDRRKKG